jgi:DNA helicase-2/ATP-dependent DNA helicase PcrA
MVIFHPTFGAGRVLAIEGLGMQKKAKVAFAEGGVRLLLLKFAKLYAQQD